MMASKKKTVFNHDWTRNSEFKSWLQPLKSSPYQARYTICQKIFELSNMGIQAVKSHCKSDGHKKMTSHTSSMDSFVVAKTKTEQPDQQVHGLRSLDPPKQQGELQEKKAVAQESPFLVSEAVTKAEIRWAFKMVKQHSSANLCSDISELFKYMFEDSEIVKKFSVGKTKAAYMIMFGLAPILKMNLRKNSCHVVYLLFALMRH